MADRTPSAKLRARGRRRLAALARLLDKLPRKRFDYGAWVGPDWAGRPDLSCGTPACALGWATTMPSLRSTIVMKREVCWPGMKPIGDGYVSLRNRPPAESNASIDESVRAGMAAFALTKAETEYLFLPDHSGIESWATPQRVARHIRRFLKHGLPRALQS